MPIEDGRAQSAATGSGEIELEAAIAKVRGAILGMVNELERFSITVRATRESLEKVALALDRSERSDDN